MLKLFFGFFSIFIFLFSLNADNLSDQFIYNNCVRIFRNLGTSEKIIYFWINTAEEMSGILSSKMVQGMKDGSLTEEEFNNLYMKPDVLYIYNLGLALKDRAEKEKNKIDKENITLIAEMFIGYDKKHHKFEELKLRKSDKLNDKISNDHIELLSKKTNINEYYLAILTDMMPYVCFSNYLYNTISDQKKNHWMNYAKKYGTENSSYVSEKLKKSIELANEAINKISEERAKSLFQEGMKFERYFIDEAMNGNLLKKIIKRKI